MYAQLLPDHIGKLSCFCQGSEREGEGEMTDDHHQRIHAGKGVWHSMGSGRSQRDGGRALHRDGEGPIGRQ